jgi:membrane protease YdiL (CAAX protease family)
MQKSSAYHPVLQVLILVLMAIIGAAIFSLLGFLAWLLIDPQASLMALTNQEILGHNLLFMKIMQIFSSTGMFIVAPIAFAYINQQKPKSYYYFDQPLSLALVFLVVSILFFSNPVFDFLIHLNQKVTLPDFLKGIENWMKQKEDQAAEITKQLLEMKTLGDLALNLLMIAIIPAIGEELFFRGSLQNIFKSWFKNHHVAIWITAILFSAIHLQFFGFFPRLFLGALFGYLLVYGKNIWLPILGHFLNNASAVVYAFILQKNGGNLETLEKSGDYPYYLYAISSIITLVLLLIFFQQTKNEKLIPHE